MPARIRSWPLLWNITFDALLIKEFPPRGPIAFANDVAFIIPGSTRRQVKAAGNQTMDILSAWARNAKMEILSQKSKHIILKGNINARPPVTKYRTMRIVKVESATYLGMGIDMTFLPHIKKQGIKARNLFGKIGRLLKVSFVANTVNLNFLYKVGLWPMHVMFGYIKEITGQSIQI